MTVLGTTYPLFVIVMNIIRWKSHLRSCLESHIYKVTSAFRTPTRPNATRPPDFKNALLLSKDVSGGGGSFPIYSKPRFD
jgi:hypothetical protein